MKKCNNCNATSADDAMFCTECGSALEINTEGNTEGNAEVKAEENNDNVEVKAEENNDNPVNENMNDNNEFKDGKKTNTETTETIETIEAISNTSGFNGMNAGQNPGSVTIASETAFAGKAVGASGSMKVGGKKLAVIIAAAVCVAVGIGGLVFGIVQANNNKDNTIVVADTGGNSGEQEIVDVEKITYVPVGKKWRVAVSDEYSAYVDSDGATVIDHYQSPAWEMFLQYDDEVPFSSVESGWSGIEAKIKSSGAENVKVGTMTVSGGKLYWADLVYGGIPMSVGFVKASDLYTFSIEIVAETSKVAHDTLETAASILETAEKNNSTNKAINEEELSNPGFDIKAVLR